MQEFNLKLTPVTPRIKDINHPFYYDIPLLIKPHSPYPPPAPCNTSSPRCIMHRTRIKRPGVVSVYPTIYKKYISSIYKISKAFRKDEQTNADQKSFHNPITYILNPSLIPPSPPRSYRECEIAAAFKSSI